MTNEALKQGQNILKRINEIDEIMRKLTPYYHNDIEIEVQKKVLNYNGEKLHYRLSYDSPLWLAIGTALRDMKNELHQQFEQLECNTEDKPDEPLKKTAIWKKWFGKNS